MTDITLRSDFDVELAKVAGDDQYICETARVSTVGADAFKTEESFGLINFLMQNRHGSPFEHGLLSFRITAPIFVWREFMRHRIGFSYNEQSGRYMEMLPVFYIPPEHRPLQQIGKPGHYTFVPGTNMQLNSVDANVNRAYEESWLSYENMLDDGVAKEVARIVLPLATYSSAYVTCNPRSMMSFLSLRTKHEDSMFPSYPQWEINQVADQMEIFFAEAFPLTHAAFNKNGRVSP
jgi:thymidylate synthase (FAD)